MDKKSLATLFLSTTLIGGSLMGLTPQPTLNLKQVPTRNSAKYQINYNHRGQIKPLSPSSGLYNFK